MGKGNDLAQQILDTAMQLAESHTWEKLHLYQVAGELGIGLEQIHDHYATKDELVEAWYDRADRAMLHATEAPGFEELTTRERLHLLIMGWLDTLAQHKLVSRDMLLYKLEPAHIHLQVQGLLRISRTVQWLREAARQESTHLQRIGEEIGLSSIFVLTVLYWINDHSTDQHRTRRFLARRLEQAERCSRFLQRFSPPPRRPQQPAADATPPSGG